jgi:hypothetical protein
MVEVREKRSNANGMYLYDAVNVHNFVPEKIPGKFSRYVGVACWIKKSKHAATSASV